MDKFDKRLDAIAKFIQQGMRMLDKTNRHLGELAAAQKRTNERVAELARSQRELAMVQKATERSLKAFIDSMRHGRNGR